MMRSGMSATEIREFDIFQYWYPMLGTLVEKEYLREIYPLVGTEFRRTQPPGFYPGFQGYLVCQSE